MTVQEAWTDREVLRAQVRAAADATAAVCVCPRHDPAGNRPYGTRKARPSDNEVRYAYLRAGMHEALAWLVADVFDEFEVPYRRRGTFLHEALCRPTLPHESLPDGERLTPNEAALWITVSVQTGRSPFGMRIRDWYEALTLAGWSQEQVRTSAWLLEAAGSSPYTVGLGLNLPSERTCRERAEKAGVRVPAASVVQTRFPEHLAEPLSPFTGFVPNLLEAPRGPSSVLTSLDDLADLDLEALDLDDLALGPVSALAPTGEVLVVLAAEVDAAFSTLDDQPVPGSLQGLLA